MADGKRPPFLFSFPATKRNQISPVPVAVPVVVSPVVVPVPVSVSTVSVVVPLGPVAQSLLPKQRTGFVFTATGSTEAYNGYAYHLTQLQKISETGDWTLHDLRRTFATNLAIGGTPIHVTEKILNHVSGTLSGVAAIYNRHSYADEMRSAVETWEATLLQLVERGAARPAPDSLAPTQAIPGRTTPA